MRSTFGAACRSLWRRRASRWLALPAAAATAAAAFMLAGASPAQAQANDLVPVLDCIEVNGQTITVFLGYDSTFATTVHIDVGPNNFFSPGVLFRNQPTDFAPGANDFAFSTTIAPGDTITWFLNGEFVVASLASPQCGVGGPPGPAGPAGPAGSARVVGSPVTITGPGLDESATATAACPDGTVLLGGGAQVEHPHDVITVLDSSYPSSTTVWTATAVALLLPRHDSATVTAYALCSLPAS
jgi:hypothetical protein